MGTGKIDSYRPLTPLRSGSGRATPSTNDSAEDDAWRRGDSIRGASMARTPSLEDRDVPQTKNDRKESGAHFDNHDVQKKWKARQNSLIKVPAPKAPKEWPNVDIWRKDCPRCGGKRHTAVAQQCNRLCWRCRTFEHIGGRCPLNKDGNNRVTRSLGTRTHSGDLGKNMDLVSAKARDIGEKVTKAGPVEMRQDEEVIIPSLVGKKPDEKKVVKPTLVEMRHDDGNHGWDMELDEPWRSFSFKLGATHQTAAKPTLNDTTRNDGTYRDRENGGRLAASRAESVSERRSSRWDVRPKDDWDQSNRLTPIDFGHDDRRQSGRLTPVDFGNNGRSQTNRLAPPFEYGDKDRCRFSQTPLLGHHQHRNREPPPRSRADRDVDMAYRRDDENLPATQDLRTEYEQLRSNCDNFRTRSEKLFSQNLTLLRDREMLRRQLEMVEMEKSLQATSATSTATPNCFDPSFWLRQMQMAELERMRSAGFDASSLRQQQLELAEAEKRRSNASDASPQLRQADIGDKVERMSNPDNPFALRQQQQDMAGMEQRPANGFDTPFPMMPMSLPGMPFGAAFTPPFHPLQMDRSWLGGFRYPM